MIRRYISSESGGKNRAKCGHLARCSASRRSVRSILAHFFGDDFVVGHPARVNRPAVFRAARFGRALAAMIARRSCGQTSAVERRRLCRSFRAHMWESAGYRVSRERITEKTSGGHSSAYRLAAETCVEGSIRPARSCCVSGNRSKRRSQV
jgi:hypothetical protein